MTYGQCEKIEFEYTRYGTLTLIGNFQVSTGELTRCGALWPRTFVTYCCTVGYLDAYGHGRSYLRLLMAIELTWLGHATWSVRVPTGESGSKTILIDPFLDDSPTAPVKSADVAADYILISHGHFDHVADAAKIARRTGAL